MPLPRPIAGLRAARLVPPLPAAIAARAGLAEGDEALTAESHVAVTPTFLSAGAHLPFPE